MLIIISYIDSPISNIFTKGFQLGKVGHNGPLKYLPSFSLLSAFLTNPFDQYYLFIKNYPNNLGNFIFNETRTHRWIKKIKIVQLFI